MTREIKFRAWDGNKKCWLQDVRDVWLCVDDGRTCTLETTGGYEAQDYLKGVNVMLMQFTGVNDKNRKDIYEGDILKDTLSGMVWRVRFGYCIKYAFVGVFVDNIEHNRQSTLNNDSGGAFNSQVEIIGNIYENPEILPNETLQPEATKDK